MSNSAVTDALYSVLAHSYALYLKTHNYHWNVRGPQFAALHKLFEKQYESLAAAIDEVAERMRALGVLVKANFPDFMKEVSFPNPNEQADWKTMIEDLATSHQIVGELVNKTIHIADEEGDDPTSDLMIERLHEHQEAIWMLKAHLS